MSTIHFNKEGFEKAVNSDSVTMVDFWAGWCGPCKMLAPVIDDIALKYDGKAVVGKVDVDEEGELSQKYGVMSIPTIVFFKGGKEIDRKVGVMPPESYTDVLDANI